MPMAGKPAHVEADFGDNLFWVRRPQPGIISRRWRSSQRAQPLGDLHVESLKAPIEFLNVASCSVSRNR